MGFNPKTVTVLEEAIQILSEGFSQLPEFDTSVNTENIRKVILDVATRMHDNYPYHHPLYIGQMLKPPHPIALLAYSLCLWINPNNHALDGGRASSAMEKEAVKQISDMLGWDNYIGHLCSGGTIANLEGLWIAGQVQGKTRKLASSKQAHYTHKRLCGVLGIPFVEIDCDVYGRLDVQELEQSLEQDDIGTVVCTMGTTLSGSVDPLDKLLNLKTKYNFRIHVDAAYGGYFCLSSNLDTDTRRAFDCLKHVDSLAIDPHKHGLQPYGCGCILFNDPSVGKFYKHDSPYTYFTSSELHLGEISIECSRPGASAVALWATQKLLPLTVGGEFGQSLENGRQTALQLYEQLSQDHRVFVPFRPELDIIVWAPRASKASVISEMSKEIFAEAAKMDLHLALANIPADLFPKLFEQIELDQEMITFLRACLMKPDHLKWFDEIWKRLNLAMERVVSKTTTSPNASKSN